MGGGVPPGQNGHPTGQSSAPLEGLPGLGPGWAGRWASWVPHTPRRSDSPERRRRRPGDPPQLLGPGKEATRVPASARAAATGRPPARPARPRPRSPWPRSCSARSRPGPRRPPTPLRLALGSARRPIRPDRRPVPTPAAAAVCKRSRPSSTRRRASAPRPGVGLARSPPRELPRGPAPARLRDFLFLRTKRRKRPRAQARAPRLGVAPQVAAHCKGRGRRRAGREDPRRMRGGSAGGRWLDPRLRPPHGAVTLGVPEPRVSGWRAAS